MKKWVVWYVTEDSFEFEDWYSSQGIAETVAEFLNRSALPGCYYVALPNGKVPE